MLRQLLKKRLSLVTTFQLFQERGIDYCRGCSCSNPPRYPGVSDGLYGPLLLASLPSAGPGYLRVSEREAHPLLVR
jgi:hypothetical protein